MNPFCSDEIDVKDLMEERKRSVEEGKQRITLLLDFIIDHKQGSSIKQLHEKYKKQLTPQMTRIAAVYAFQEDAVPLLSSYIQSMKYVQMILALPLSRRLAKENLPRAAVEVLEKAMPVGISPLYEKHIFVYVNPFLRKRDRRLDFVYL